MMNQPHLVDYSLFSSPAPKVIKRPITMALRVANNSLLINVIGFLIIFLSALFMYQRMMSREEKAIEHQNSIIGFHQYVKDNIK